MINIKTNNSELILIKLPKDAIWWKIDKLPDTTNNFIAKTLNIKSQIFKYGLKDGVYFDPSNLYLPEGSWEIVGKFNELKDEDFESLVSFKNYNTLNKDESPLIMWEDYECIFDNEGNLFSFDTAKQSFKSLCRFYNLEDDLNNYLIIKKEKQ